jgi:hypothetical protein
MIKYDFQFVQDCELLGRATRLKPSSNSVWLSLRSVGGKNKLFLNSPTAAYPSEVTNLVK